jgi:hypothetical protein
VYFVVIFETVQTILSGIDAFNWAAKGFGNFSIIPSPGLSAIDTPFMDGVISIIVQLFFCYRIWVINKNAWWFSIFTAMVSAKISPPGRADNQLQDFVTSRHRRYVCRHQGW